MKPHVIYCIEQYEYFNLYGPQAEYHDYIEFLFLVSCREGTAQLQYGLRNILEACEQHEPGLYHYLQNLWADMEEFYKSETRLIQALEQDGFDIARLLYVFLDNYDLEYLENWIKKNGKSQIRRTVEDIQKSMSEGDDALLQYGEFLGMQKDVTRRVYDAMKKVVLGYLPTLNLLETDQIRSLNACLDDYASAMVEEAMSEWQRLEFPEEYDDEDDDETPTMEGLRQFYLKYRSEHPVKGSENNPIFCVEIVEFLEGWELWGSNKVKVWYKLTCAEGEWYNDVDFQDLMVEAMLNFPDIFADAMKYYKASDSPMPRDPAMLHGLQHKGHDLLPVLASYVANRENFLPMLREALRLQRLFPNSENSFYKMKREDLGARDPAKVEMYQLVNLIRDGLVREGIAAILRELPEFHMLIKNSFLDYLEYWAYHFHIDPINDMDEVLDRAIELKQSYKLEF